MGLRTSRSRSLILAHVRSGLTIACSMAASFYSSPLIGATTTLACFAHEIPHEIADYSILVRSGFTKKQAMQSQFLTAIGAFVRHSIHFTRCAAPSGVESCTGLTPAPLMLRNC